MKTTSNICLLSLCLFFQNSYANTGTLVDGKLINQNIETNRSIILANLFEMNLASKDDFYKAIEVLNKHLENEVTEKKEKRLVSEMIKLFELAAENNTDDIIVKNAIEMIQELNTSLIYRKKSPLPESVYLHKLPSLYRELLNNRVGLGKTENPSQNLINTEFQKDLSVLSPADSTFWTMPDNISEKDLYFGFNRQDLPTFSDKICNYNKAKTGFGTNPGFTVVCDGVTYFLKFSEESTQAFATRIFWALGYNTNIIDNAPYVNVTYERKILQEFNTRKDVTTPVKLIPSVTITKLHLQKYHDPFKSIRRLVLRDGTIIENKDIKAFLFKKPNQKKPEMSNSNYIIENEKQIAYLATTSTSIEVKNDNFVDVGPWSWDTLNHQNRRELRGMGLLAAWLNWYDARWDNNKIRIIDSKSKSEMVHLLSDLGSVLGVAGKTLKKHEDNPQKFPSEFTTNKNGKFIITNFQTIEKNEAFKQMNVDDARWMARMIAKISEKQIRDALTAAGFPQDSIEIFHTKLLSRRSKMLQDLGIR